MDAGDRRCTAHNARGERCKKWAIKGLAVCLAHGGGTAASRAAGERRCQEQQALELVGKISPGVDLTQYGDPLDAMEHVLAMSHYLAVRLAGLVGQMADGDLAYRSRFGEQLRGEVTAAQRALADLGRVAAESVKLGLAERRARITDNQVGLIVHALTIALEASGLDLEGQDAARRVLGRAAG
jgi:hypothetical protein